MQLTVSEYAHRSGLSERRVRQLVKDGELAASRAGRIWIIETPGSMPRRLPGRPMSAQNALLLARWLEGLDVDAQRSHRFRGIASRLSAEDHPELLLASLLARRARRKVYAVQDGDLPELREDSRMKLSGVSHEQSGLLAAREVEGYVSPDDLESVVRDYLMVETPVGKGSVLLHVAELNGPVPPLFVAADLSERGGVRELQASREIIREQVGRD
ncbi:helix-turn-helix domain-containing protein [Citricoccus nitrophenolicus]|uniref:helix-turn-helix domain-containing protein n=1 Tax=Citricoccus nitrophenolicus TaxID=863575 RepID=UPI0039B498CF